MSEELSPDLYAVLLEAYDMAKAQIALIENGFDPMDNRRLAVLQRMLIDLSRVLKATPVALH